MKIIYLQVSVAFALGALLRCDASTNLRSVSSSLSRFIQDPSTAEDEKSIENIEEQDDDSEHLESDEEEASVDAKNLASEIDYRETLKSEEKRDENAAHTQDKFDEALEPGCGVAKTAKLDVAPDATDVLTTVPQIVSIGKKYLSVHYEGRADAPSLKIPIIELKTPIETLIRTQRCFRIFHKAKPYVFCAADTKERDSWVADLYKAVFCINSGRTASKKAVKETQKGEEANVPARSTKVQRWMKQLRDANEEMAKQAEAEENPSRPSKKEVQEIEIIGSANSSPKVTVNGDDVVLPSNDGDNNMNEGNQE